MGRARLCIEWRALRLGLITSSRSPTLTVIAKPLTDCASRSFESWGGIGISRSDKDVRAFASPGTISQEHTGSSGEILTKLRKSDTPATVDDIAGLFQHINLMQRTLLSIGAIALRSAQSPKEIEQIDAQVQAMVDDFTNRVTALAKRLDIDVGDN